MPVLRARYKYNDHHDPKTDDRRTQVLDCDQHDRYERKQEHLCKSLDRIQASGFSGTNICCIDDQCQLCKFGWLKAKCSDIYPSGRTMARTSYNVHQHQKCYCHIQKIFGVSRISAIINLGYQKHSNQCNKFKNKLSISFVSVFLFLSFKYFTP